MRAPAGVWPGRAEGGQERQGGGAHRAGGVVQGQEDGRAPLPRQARVAHLQQHAAQLCIQLIQIIKSLVSVPPPRG